MNDPITIILRKVSNKSMGVTEAKIILDNLKHPETYKRYPNWDTLTKGDLVPATHGSVYSDNV